MMTRILAVATALLAVLAINQYNTIGQLRSDLAATEARVALEARSMAAESMKEQGPEVQRVMAWLNDFYKSPEGLKRPEGLWIDGHPDYEGLSGWVFDVYLRRRLQGDTEEQARAAIETAIRQSDEYRRRHP
jgi:hypothetical protein